MEQNAVQPGTCRACGRDLVRVPGAMTYHPAVALGPAETCPALLPIQGVGSLSFDVPDAEFVPTATPERTDS